MAGRAGRCHACCAIPPHPGIRAPFSSSSSVPRMANPGGVSSAPRESDWVEQSDARASAGVSSGNCICLFFKVKVSFSVNPCLPFDRTFCLALLAALLPTPR